mmetsp:Transcript_32484/g.64480  ORF Transcript_32484/g.64480 Transcript_32484/m.64480 type:complete len:267 (+) Transcript_32484:1678-2478(+)
MQVSLRVSLTILLARSAPRCSSLISLFLCSSLILFFCFPRFVCADKKMLLSLWKLMKESFDNLIISYELPPSCLFLNRIDPVICLLIDRLIDFQMEGVGRGSVLRFRFFQNSPLQKCWLTAVPFPSLPYLSFRLYGRCVRIERISLCLSRRFACDGVIICDCPITNGAGGDALRAKDCMACFGLLIAAPWSPPFECLALLQDRSFTGGKSVKSVKERDFRTEWSGGSKVTKKLTSTERGSEKDREKERELRGEELQVKSRTEEKKR